jgi:mRNA interferase YafQ
MLTPSYTKQFAKDLKRMLNRGKSGEKIKQVLRSLVNEDQLDPRHKDHKLIGRYKHRWECHIEPDSLLIYKRRRDEIIIEKTGTFLPAFEGQCFVTWNARKRGNVHHTKQPCN